jgi:hypothetical protein
MQRRRKEICRGWQLRRTLAPCTALQQRVIAPDMTLALPRSEQQCTCVSSRPQTERSVTKRSSDKMPIAMLGCGSTKYKSGTAPQCCAGVVWGVKPSALLHCTVGDASQRAPLGMHMHSNIPPPWAHPLTANVTCTAVLYDTCQQQDEQYHAGDDSTHQQPHARILWGTHARAESDTAQHVIIF